MSASLPSNKCSDVVPQQPPQNALLQKLQGITGKSVKELQAVAADKIHVATYYLLFDASISMEAPEKLKQARTGAIGFAEEVMKEASKVGLIVFSDDAEEILAWGCSEQQFKHAVKEIQASGSTNLTAAITLATERLRRTKGHKCMCVVTDGVPDDEKSAIIAAEHAKKEEIEIRVVGTDDADESFLERIASRPESAKKVQRGNLAKAVRSMAKMLPPPSRTSIKNI